MINNNELKHFIIRVSKEDSAFIYFQFEANEGLCFFSTLKSSLKQPYRDIEIFSPISLEKEFSHLLNYLGTDISIQYLLEETVEDRDYLKTQDL